LGEDRWAALALGGRVFAPSKGRLVGEDQGLAGKRSPVSRAPWPCWVDPSPTRWGWLVRGLFCPRPALGAKLGGPAGADQNFVGGGVLGGTKKLRELPLNRDPPRAALQTWRRPRALQRPAGTTGALMVCLGIERKRRAGKSFESALVSPGAASFGGRRARGRGANVDPGERPALGVPWRGETDSKRKRLGARGSAGGAGPVKQAKPSRAKGGEEAEAAEGPVAGYAPRR